MIPYGHQSINDDDIEAVVAVLRSDWLTQGPVVEEFEQALVEYCGVKYAVAVGNGTDALQTAYAAIGLEPGDEIITSPLTFAATANAALWLGARPVFVDIDEKTGILDLAEIERSITPRTKAIAPIDYAGRPIDYAALNTIALKHNLMVVSDGCHALGASRDKKKVGSLADLTVFSFHPVKSITTGEGGAILTNNQTFFEKMKQYRSHGITKQNFVHESPGQWYHEMQILGQNYRLTDMQSALGLSQLKRLDHFVAQRRSLAERYDKAFNGHPSLTLPILDTEAVQSAWHLYVVRLKGSWTEKRAEVFAALRSADIGVQVHYIPVYWHPYYEQIGFIKGLCPKAETWYNTCLSLPMYPDLAEAEQEYIIEKLKKILE